MADLSSFPCNTVNGCLILNEIGKVGSIDHNKSSFLWSWKAVQSGTQAFPDGLILLAVRLKLELLLMLVNNAIYVCGRSGALGIVLVLP